MAGPRPWQGRRIPGTPARTLTTVTCELTFEVDDRAALAMLIAPAARGLPVVEEELSVLLDGLPLDVREVALDHGGRAHMTQSAAGTLTVAYNSVVGDAADVVPVPPTEAERLVFLRQSRYCPSDRLEGFAADEFGPAVDPEECSARIAEWVFERVSYELGSSGPLDTAVETLLGGHGVCRDFAHLTIGLCRAVGIPARLVAVYAPGLSPMDFHAVTEVAVGDRWLVLDATRLAPRSSLVRIATGRDAADTAFCSTVDGYAELTMAFVGASTDGDLPYDDHQSPFTLP